MSRSSTLTRIQDLKAEVLDLSRLDGLAGEGWAQQEIMVVALRLETLGKRMAAKAGRTRGTDFTPPPRPAGETEDWGARQLLPRDRT